MDMGMFNCLPSFRSIIDSDIECIDAKLFLALLANPRHKMPDGDLIFEDEIVKAFHMQPGNHEGVTFRNRECVSDGKSRDRTSGQPGTSRFRKTGTRSSTGSQEYRIALKFEKVFLTLSKRTDVH